MRTYPEKVSSESHRFTVNNNRKTGRQISPIIAEREELHQAAIDAFRIILQHDRDNLDFNQLKKERRMPDGFVTDCYFYNSDKPVIDTGSSSLMTGLIDEGRLSDILETKQVCAECPLRKECLAVSMTSKAITKQAKTERILPGTEGRRIPLTMSDFLIFGGYTPQERGIIYNDVCDWLEIRDAFVRLYQKSSTQKENETFLKCIRKQAKRGESPSSPQVLIDITIEMFSSSGDLFIVMEDYSQKEISKMAHVAIPHLADTLISQPQQ